MEVFFFKQKTAYEMRISDWSSDVCSSDLLTINGVSVGAVAADTNSSNRASSIAAAINSYSSQTGVAATILDSAPGQVVLSSSTGNIVVGTSGTATAASTGLTAATTNATTSTGFAALDLPSVAGAEDAINDRKSTRLNSSN